MSGKQAMLEQLLADEVRCVFGNPGTTEQAFMAALSDYPQISYYLALHEGVAVAMADAYARATRRAAFVQLHIAAGLGNAMGALYNAHAGKSPMVCYVGQSPREGVLQEPYLSGDLVGLARPFTKWAAEIQETSDIPRALRRAFKVAQEPPQGPVVLSIPIDLLDGEEELTVEKTSHVEWRCPPSADTVDEVARLLLEATRPAIMVGDEIGLNDSGPTVLELAELLGAPVLTGFSNQVNVATSHPLYRSRSGQARTSAQTRESLAPFDLLLAVGTPLPSSFFADRAGPIPDATVVVHVALDSWELGKNHAGALLVRAEPGTTCHLLSATLQARASDATRIAWRARREAVERETDALRPVTPDTSEAGNDAPVSSQRLMAEICRRLPSDAVVFDETVGSGPTLEPFLEPESSWRYFKARGGGKGAGLPGTVGLQIAFPDRPVVGVIADGSAMFSITALWTAAHYDLPVTFVICNNRAYGVLKKGLRAYRGGEGAYPGMDLIDPEIDFVGLAESLGVRAERVDHPDGLGDALERAMKADHPTLVDVVMQPA